MNLSIYMFNSIYVLYVVIFCLSHYVLKQSLLYYFYCSWNTFIFSTNELLFFVSIIAYLYV